ncbi:pentapeptide repeat-containing protein [Saccharothrix syringae]|uniref:pentapeptide repeat-containing protein n=1 Tax=Saccharothrix syringae TaxID=103733 RepID=UPI00068F44B6|nr:pentapeptide repeat-containing protein [Saccharothrix syringae]
MLSPWVTAMVAASALVAAVLVLVLLWRWADRLGLPPDRVATAQLEAVKIAASVLVAAGGLYALYLTARRQRTQELELAQRDRVQEHAERVADDARDDARTRRTNDLYAKAVEQLGSEHHAVRHGALYALEHLAQDNPDYRAPVAKVLCAYLRSPFTPPSDAPTTARPLGVRRLPRRHRAHRLAAPRPTTGTPRPGPHVSLLGRHQEREVRLTAQRILADHLRPGPDADHPAPTYWQDIGLDLTDATLIDFDFAHCRINSTATFTNATFTGDARFDEATFTGAARFGGVSFAGDATFTNATFTGDARFDEATFAAAWFDEATFTGDATFTNATFTGDARFDEATFAAAWFSEATFTGDATFTNATFTGDARFDEATFTGAARFGGVSFAGAARFGGVSFAAAAWFTGATFTGDARFGGVSFAAAAWFTGATFAAAVRFGEATFVGDARFSGVSFAAARFGEATFTGAAWFDEAAFTGTATFTNATFTGDAGFGEATFAAAAWFTGATFAAAWFDGVSFAGDAWFGEATFAAAWFDGVSFAGDAWFGEATFTAAATCPGTRVAVRRDRVDVWMEGWTATDAEDGEWTYLVPVPAVLSTPPVDSP